MKTKLLLAFVAVLFAMLSSCSSNDDEENLHFTQYPEMIINGPVTVNDVSTYVGYSTSVDVRGYHGEVKAVSSNENVVTVKVLTPTSSENSTDGRSLYIMGQSEGSAVITATDGDGHSARLMVTVYAVQSTKYRVANASQDEVVIEGATEEEAAAIRKDIMDSHSTDSLYLLEQIPNLFSNFMYKLLVYKKASESQTQITYYVGERYSPNNPDPSTNYFRFYKDGDINEKADYTDYLFDVNGSSGNIKVLLTEKYKAEYPNVTKVMLVMSVVMEE